MTTQKNTVNLECVAEGTRLRIRIVSSGYKHDANCQFPSNIRKKGARYSVPSDAITLARGPRGKYFYRVNKNLIIVLESNEKVEITVYGDDEDDCAICFDQKKQMVFVPCGHYCSCTECAKSIQTTSGTCPMCRATIREIVDRSHIS